MPLPSTFASASAKAEGEFTKISTGPAPIGGGYWLTLNQNIYGTSLQGNPASVKVDSVGNVYEFGNYYDNAGGARACYLHKYDKNGNVLWSLTFYNNSNGYTTSSYLTASSMCMDSLGNIYVAIINGIPNPNACVIIKLDSSGNTIYSMGQSNLIAIGLACDSANNLYISGNSQTGGGSFPIYKYNSSGTYINSTYIVNNFYNSSIYFSGQILVDSSNNIYLGFGIANPNNSSKNFPNVVKLDSNLNVIWSRFGANSNLYVDNNNILSMALDASNNIYILSGPNNTTITNNYFISKLDSSGNGIWNINMQGRQNRSNGTTTYSYFWPMSITVDPVTNNFLLTGTQIYPFPPTGSTYYISWYIKYDPSGTFISSGSIYGQAALAAGSIVTAPYGFATYDISGNVYFYGSMLANSSYSTGGKINLVYQTSNNYVLKDSNNFQTTHQFGTSAVNGIPIQYQNGQALPLYTDSGAQAGAFATSGIPTQAGPTSTDFTTVGLNTASNTTSNFYNKTI